MRKKTLTAFIISFILLTAVITLNRVTFNSIKEYTGQVDHTREVITTFERLSNHFKSAQIYTPSLDTGSIKNLYNFYKTEADSVSSELNILLQFVKDNKQQADLVKEIDTKIKSQLTALMQKNTSQMIQSGEAWRLNVILSIHQNIRQGIIEENELLAKRKKELNAYTRLNNFLSTAFAVIAVSIIFFTFFNIFFLSKKRNWLEGFLESILDSSKNGIIHYKAVKENGTIVDFKIEFANKAVDLLLGIKSEDIIGKNLKNISSYVRESGLFEKYIRVMETGESMEFEDLYKQRNIERWLVVSLIKLDDGLTASFYDITPLKKFEGQLKEKITELERSNVELEQYAYVASHDLQEPLRKIRSIGSYLQDTQANKLDVRGQEQLKKIMESAERMSALIKQILSFSSLKKEDMWKPTDLNEVFNAVLHDLDLMVAQKNAKIETDSLPVIEAISLQMTQLFYSLLNNALKFGKDDGKLFISISCRQIAEEEKNVSFIKGVIYYEIIFRDNGIGFSAEYAEQIFGLFKRLNNKQIYPGSGIGLALCKKVVDNHHGSIKADGIENAGAAFFLYLPQHQ
jgi:signal transduction histidine kinase